MGLVRAELPITKDQYERAQLNSGFIAKEDMHDIFTDDLLYGYGVYSPIACKKHSEVTGADTYVVNYTTGTSCD